jgi:hypothetical protein
VTHTLYLPSGNVHEYRRRPHPFRLLLECRAIDPDFQVPFDDRWYLATDADLVNLTLAGLRPSEWEAARAV